MPLDPNFPADPWTVLHPDVRWYPGEELLARETGAAQLIPPLVDKVRRGVLDWRNVGYAGASDTTRALLNWWFERDHVQYGPDGPELFRWYFGQREAVESAIWLYEVQRARDPHALIKYDSSGAVSTGMFDEVWPRYVLKLATGAGKTKVASLLIAWSYFHRRYEDGSPLSTNVLLIAPNIIVLDRLKLDFDGGAIFLNDPVLPENGFEGRNWKADFQVMIHIQDEVGTVSPSGNLFLTNIHRVGENERKSAVWDLRDEFLGPKPVAKTTDSKTDLGVIVRQVPDLLVINDEAHHVRRETDWWAQIADLDAGLKRKGGGNGLALQLDLTATPRGNKGGIFPQTISDYPLVEAIAQEVVKTPVLPDAASRARLTARPSDDYTEMFRDHLELGVIEWRKSYQELEKAGKKSVLFVMTDVTENCDRVAEWLEQHNPDLRGRVLVIHTNKSGEISEAASSRAAKADLEELRRQSREIDSWDSKYRAVVSVMMLREGWDVRNVTTIVGLRAYVAQSSILPEQTLGRGLRKMFFGTGRGEKVSVLGTPAFLDFVETIRNEGVELETRPMGPTSPANGPMVIEPDKTDPEKVERLDIELPKLKARIERNMLRLDELDAATIEAPRLPLKIFTPDQQREIVFRNINTGEESHRTQLDAGGIADWRNAVGWFAKSIKDDLRLVGGFDVLFGKLTAFVEDGLFDRKVDLDDPNVLRNLSEVVVSQALSRAIKTAINKLTVHDSGDARIVERVKLSETRPQVTRRRPAFESDKSLLNLVAGDNAFEQEFAEFLNAAPDVQAFYKNSESTNFTLEYQAAGGGIIRDYRPDFVARDADGVIWIIETKGREDIQDARKWERLKLWCADATEQDAPRAYRAMFVREEDWDAHRAASFAEASQLYETSD
jgi:type III restriction enzyme